MKEKVTYEKEVEQTEEKISKMKDAGKDEYDIKKMVCKLFRYSDSYESVKSDIRIKLRSFM